MIYVASALLLAVVASAWRKQVTVDWIFASALAAVSVWNAGLAVAYFGVVP